MKRRTKKEIDQLGKLVDKRIAAGEAAKDACIATGVSSSVYYAYVKRSQSPQARKPHTKRETSYATIPVAQGFELRGSPEEIARFVKELSRSTNV